LQFRMNKKYAVAVPALAVATVMLSGCGGGGGGSSPGPSTPVASQLRTFQAGDTWTYAVDGWEYRSGTPNLYVTAGAYTLGVQIDPSAFGGPSKSFTHSLEVKWNNNTSLTQNYLEDFVQNSDGSVSKFADTLDNTVFGTAGNIEYADGLTYIYKTITTTVLDKDGNPIVTVTDIPVDVRSIGSQPLLPGTWGSGSAFASDDSYTGIAGNADGSISPSVKNHEHIGISYLAKETVTVPAGTFETYKVNIIKGFQGQNKTVNATAWWAPQLGSFVKMDTTETVSTGQQVLHYQLKSTTVAH